MTREEANEELERAFDILDHSCHMDNRRKEAFNLARVTLSASPCEDVISRQAVNTLIDELARAISDERCCISRGRSTATIMRDILHLPPVTPQPKTGHWIRWYEQKEHDWGTEHVPHCKCSECGKEYDSHSSLFIKYCNECGTKIQEVEE